MILSTAVIGRTGKELKGALLTLLWQRETHFQMAELFTQLRRSLLPLPARSIGPIAIAVRSHPFWGRKSIRRGRWTVEFNPLAIALVIEQTALKKTLRNHESALFNHFQAKESIPDHEWIICVRMESILIKRLINDDYNLF